jgi:hypothetical protein
MTILEEANLHLSLPAGVSGRRFDDEDHGLAHCMKAVDFIVELPDRWLFIEFKDPDNPKGRLTDRNAFVKQFLSGRLDEDLTSKYRDSFLYRWASGQVEKPVYYLVLVALERATEADLLTRTEALKRRLPVSGPPSGVWLRPIVAGCSVFNLDAWNRYLPDYSVTRVGL